MHVVQYSGYAKILRVQMDIIDVVVVYVEGVLRSGQIREAFKMRRRENKTRKHFLQH